MHTTNIQKKVIGALLLVLVLVGVVWALYTYIGRISESLIALESERVRLHERGRYLEGLADLTVTVDAERGRIEEQFVMYDREVRYIEHIESLGEAAGVSLEVDSVALDMLALDEESSYPALHLSVIAGGGWGEVLRFVKLVEASSLAARVTRIDVEQGGGRFRDVDGVEWGVSLQVKVAFVPEEE